MMLGIALVEILRSVFIFPFIFMSVVMKSHFSRAGIAGLLRFPIELAFSRNLFHFHVGWIRPGDCIGWGLEITRCQGKGTSSWVITVRRFFSRYPQHCSTLHCINNPFFPGGNIQAQLISPPRKRYQVYVSIDFLEFKDNQTL
jgi:hypothetical protein